MNRLMSWKGIVKVTFPSHLQTLKALFPKSKVLKGLVSRSALILTLYQVVKTYPFSISIRMARLLLSFDCEIN